MTIKRLLLGLLALLIAGLTALFLAFFERYTEEVDRGWGPQAWRNPYLAAEQFLAKTGLQSRRADNIAVLAELPANATLYVASSTQVYNPQRARELLDWVERGGHAIVVAHSAAYGDRDWLLEQLQVTLEEGREDLIFEYPFRQLLGDDAEQYSGKSASEMLREHNRKLREEKGEDGTSAQQDEPAEKAKPPRNPDVDPVDLITLATADGRDYQLHFDAGYLLHHPAINGDGGASATEPVFWAKIWRDDIGVPFMQFERGEGLITLMADGGIWRSQRIGHFDHAYFLGLLAAEGEFVFLTQPRFDSLFELARRYAAEFFLAGGLALLAWLLLRARRFGPLAATPELARRSLLEHISACGHYYWRADKCERLLLNLRQHLLRRLGGENAVMGTRRRLCTKLSAATGLSESAIAACLWGDLPRSEEAFTERMRNLQQIEAAL
ncbi:DUF4350 domain-containing protein [Microbulbifer marinus]|uniref:DUF4350 domain-containing protein n=1 Tax=Microbulbifer marinus TaxID=658218 RepID=A0A1H3YRV9_9GAMM|nr:DUF4350 domain-containing protein [Microbulbifer marinus]SEA14147.1 protein of unknown function [Microbulbifer marinus]